MNWIFNLRPLAASCAAALCCVAATNTQNAWAADEGVLLTGYNAQFGGASAQISDSELSRDALCGADGAASMLNLFNQIVDRLDGRRLAQGGISASESQQEVQAAISELCQTQEAFSVDAYAMTYSDCRMTMDTASILTDISLPPGGGSAVMSMTDFYRAESNRMTFDRTLDAASGMVSMSTSEFNWTGPGDSKQVAGYPTTRWDFQYEGGMGFGGEEMAGLEALGLNATFTNTGYAYYSTTAPGMDVVQAFFDKFASQVQADQGASGMFGPILNTMVDVLAKGMPLEMEQTVQTSMGGMSRGDMRSKIKATGLRTVTLPGDYCDLNLVPDHFAVTDMNEELGGMSGSAQGSGAGSAETGQAMSELNKAMEQMPPEQREAMKGMGLGGLFGGGAKNANPAGQAAQQQAPQAPAGTAGSSGGLPSSAELTTDDVTQSVQNHLEALGYSVGNTNGNLDTDTVIAISQFQAEKGMEVTGEVSPQLLGILGAEVDSR